MAADRRHTGNSDMQDMNVPHQASGKVSVVMPAYNVGAFIAEAIQSVLDQTYPDWELVIVDDGATDNTASIIATFADPRIIVVHQANGGLTAARNSGLSKISGDWVLFLDSDDVLRPDALEHLMRAAALDRGVPPAVIYGDYMRIDEAGTTLGRRELLGKIRTQPSGDLLGFFLQGFVQMIGTAIVRRDVVTRVGRIQVGLEPMEDWVWFTLAALHGEFVSVDRIVMDYRMRPSSLSMTAGLAIDRYKPALDAVFENEAVRQRFPARELNSLRARREASIFNFIAAQNVRGGNYAPAARAYAAGIRRSVRKAPKGAIMIALAAFGF